MLQPLAPWSDTFLDLVFLPGIYFATAFLILWGPATMRAIREGKAEMIPYTLRETLIELWHREMRLPTLILPLRVLWPALLFIAVLSAGFAADATANAIQYVSHAAVQVDKIGYIQWQSVWYWFSRYGKGGSDLLGNLGYRFGAALEVCVAVLLTVVAVTVLLIPTHLGSGNRSALRTQVAFSWRHLKLFLGLLVFSYGVGSLVFSMLNALILAGVNTYENANQKVLDIWHWVPFVQPDPLAMPCLLLLLFFMIRGRPGKERPAR